MLKLTEHSSTPSAVNFYGIPSNNIYQYWNEVETLIAKGLEYSDGKYETWDIFTLIESKQMQLWIITEGEKIIACGVTQIVIYPQKKVCLIVLVSGKDFDRWEHFIKEIRDWARSINCQTIETYGRPGWKKKLKDWTEIHNVLRINIDESLH